MKNIFRILLISAVVVLSISSCQKDDPGVNIMDRVFNISFSRNALAYVNIPIGKYFVYNVTGYAAQDSIVVVGNILDVVNFPRDNNISFPEHNIERFRIRMNKYLAVAGGGVITTEWLRGSTRPAPFNPYDSSSVADIKLELSGSGTGQLIFYGRDNLAGTQTLVVEGITYTGVISTESNNGLPISDPAYQKNVFYWAKDLGIIKRVQTTYNGLETTWTLLRHN